MDPDLLVRNAVQALDAALAENARLRAENKRLGERVNALEQTLAASQRAATR